MWAGGSGSTFQEEVQEHQAELRTGSAVGGDPGDPGSWRSWRSWILTPRFTLASSVHPCRLHQRCLTVFFHCGQKEVFLDCTFWLLWCSSLVLPGLERCHGGAADITPACPVHQPFHNSHFHQSVMSSNIPASRVPLLARRIRLRWLFESALLFKYMLIILACSSVSI